MSTKRQTQKNESAKPTIVEADAGEETVSTSAETVVGTPVEPVESAVAPTLAPKVEEPKEEPKVVSNGSELNVNKDRLTALGVSILTDVEEFAKVMSNETMITPEVGRKAQEKMWWTIKRLLLNTTDVEFRDVFGAVLLIMHKNKVNKYGRPAAFDSSMIFRFANLTNITGDEVNQYKNIFITMVRTADPANRHLVAKQIGWSAVTDNNLPEQARARLLSFYRVQ